MIESMRIEAKPGDVFTIYGAPGLDPITVVTQDIAFGHGRIIVECYGAAWSAYWGAISAPRAMPNVREFVASISADYLVDKLWPTTQRRTKRCEQYLHRIAEAVIEALKQCNGSTEARMNPPRSSVSNGGGA